LFIEITKKNFSNKIAVFISRVMSSWLFIIILMICSLAYVVDEKLLNGPKLDTFNLVVSLYTIFVELIILRATLSLRDMDHNMMRNISKKEDEILKQVRNENNTTER